MDLGQFYLPSASRSSARNLSNTTPGSSGLKKVEPLLAFAWATEETPMYITRAFINDRLYASDPSSTGVDRSRRFLSVAGKDELDLPRRY